MKTYILPAALAAALAQPAAAGAGQAAAAPASAAAPAAAAVPAAPAAAPAQATNIYRHVMPDGRIVYSDEPLEGAKVDHTITVAPAIPGNLWTSEPGARPRIAPQTTSTPVKRVDPPRRPAPGKSTIAVPDAVLAEVMRAEMLLEDALARQQAGAKPRPEEIRDNSAGGLSYNEAYFSRQRRLARDVDYARSELNKARAARDGVRATN